MTRVRTPRVESFGPKLLAALLSAAIKPLTVTLSYNQAVRFRQRLYRLRAAMREEKHERYGLVSRVIITIHWGDNVEVERVGTHIIPLNRTTQCKVTISPNDSEFDLALARAGLDDSLGHSDPLIEIVPKSGPSELQALEALLEDIGK